HLQGPRAGEVDAGDGLRRPGGGAGGAGQEPGRLWCGPGLKGDRMGTGKVYPRDEVKATVDRYHELRRRIDEGLEEDAFGALAGFYTEDAVYVDGAWGRLEGREVIANWLVDSMVGMEDWKFPVEFTAIEGND